MKKNIWNYVKHDSIPHICHIEVTYACNQKCIFCYNPDKTKLGDISAIDKLVRLIVKSQIPHIYLIGGANAETHEFLNQSKGSFKKTLENIRYYVGEGHDVRCIPVLTGYNYDQIYEIIGIAANLGMESIYVDRYEDGGIGAVNSCGYRLKPTRDQFCIAVGQIIQAKHDFTVFEGRVGFGTAIPYCLDERMITENIASNCGVGTYFCAINPRGEFRMCNQSQLFFGNVFKEPIEVIWNKPALDIFRDLSWISEPCKSCKFLFEGRSKTSL